MQLVFGTSVSPQPYLRLTFQPRVNSRFGAENMQNILWDIYRCTFLTHGDSHMSTG